MRKTAKRAGGPLKPKKKHLEGEKVPHTETGMAN